MLPSSLIFRVGALVLYVTTTSCCWVHSFSQLPVELHFSPKRSIGLHQTEDDSDQDIKNTSWMKRGLLISSFSDGVQNNEGAKDFLMHSLVSALTKERQQLAEKEVADSAVQSPCCGPDLTALGRLESADTMSSDLDNNTQSWRDALKSLTEGEDSEDLEVRLLFIPTALYALRPDSQNTPGKQRQRARADGKKKRNIIASMLSELFDQKAAVLAITADLDDNSAKQPEGSSDSSRFPSNAREALNEWKPHVIYVQGGNTFWLWHCVEKGDWKEDLVKACTGDNAAVYCGASAGAIIAGEYVETACWKGWDDPRVVPGRESYEEWKGIKGLELVGNSSFFPHMTSDWQSTVDRNRGEFHAESDAICISDEEVYCVNGNAQSIELNRAPQLV